jgi:tRNA-specific adenosine deaminase 2
MDSNLASSGGGEETTTATNNNNNSCNNDNKSSHERFMEHALREAKLALDEGEIPVGCVFVDEAAGTVVARGHNKTNESRNGTKHAEIVAMDAYCKERGGGGVCGMALQDFSSYTLYVTCEPCIMCAAAISRVGVKVVYFGCKNERFGGNGSILRVHDGLAGVQKYDAIPGILCDEAINLFQTFYSTENRRAPENKRKRKPDRVKQPSRPNNNIADNVA